MKTKYFVKHPSYIPLPIILLIPYASFVVPLIGTAFKLRSIPVGVLIFVVLATLITVPLCIRIPSMGLYIDGKDVTIKRAFTAKKIDPRDIVAIKILQAYYEMRLSSGPVFGANGAPEYTAYLLKSVTNDMCRFRGRDTRFFRMYDKHIICTIVSDLEAIEYLKTLNPRIRII